MNDQTNRTIEQLRELAAARQVVGATVASECHGLPLRTIDSPCSFCGELSQAIFGWVVLVDPRPNPLTGHPQAVCVPSDLLTPDTTN